MSPLQAFLFSHLILILLMLFFVGYFAMRLFKRRRNRHDRMTSLWSRW